MRWATLYKSTNGGAKWTSLPNGGGLYSLVINPQSTNTLYAVGGNGIAGYNVMTSTDGGSTWAPTGSGLPTTGEITGLAIDPVTPTTLYVATSQGVYKTVNSGGSWSPSNTGQSGPTYSVRIDPTSSSHLFATGTEPNLTAAIYESTNAGANWTAFPTQGIAEGAISDFEINPTTPGILYVTLYTEYRAASGVFVNKNHAAQWSAISSGLGIPPTSVNQIVISPKTTSTLFVATTTGFIRPPTAARSGKW